MAENQTPATKAVEYKDPSLLKSATLFRACIYVVNETDGPICVYHQPTKAGRVFDKFKAAAGVNPLGGLVGFDFGAAMKELDKGKQGRTVIQSAVIKGKPQPIPMEEAESYVSIQRLDADGNALDLWDCVDQFVRKGTKLTISGMAAITGQFAAQAVPTTQSSA